MKPALASQPPFRPGRNDAPERSRLRRLALALALLSTLRCGDAPTQPATPALASTPTPASTRTPAATPTPPFTPTPGPTPTPLDLSGDWTGTFEGDRFTTPEAIAMRLSHVGDRIRGHFNMRCFGTSPQPVELDGTLGGFPHVSLRVNDQTVCLMTGVSVTSTRITLWSRSSNECVGARLNLTR